MTTHIDVDRAAIKTAADSRHAHHEAGHAVAAVARGGYLLEIVLGQADWSNDDLDADTPGYTSHRTEPENAPFVTFAGPWATAMWMVENDPDVDSFDDAMEYAWDDSVDGDTAKYGGLVDQLNDEAHRLGLGHVGALWEDEWCGELEELWPVIRAVAAMLLRGETVTHDVVLAAIRHHTEGRRQ